MANCHCWAQISVNLKWNFPRCCIRQNWIKLALALDKRRTSERWWDFIFISIRFDSKKNLRRTIVTIDNYSRQLCCTVCFDSMTRCSERHATDRLMNFVNFYDSLENILSKRKHCCCYCYDVCVTMKRFKIGPIKLIGFQFCHPCTYMMFRCMRLWVWSENVGIFGLSKFTQNFFNSIVQLSDMHNFLHLL